MLAIQVVLAAFSAVAIALQALKAGSPDFNTFWAAQHTDLPYNSALVSKLAGPSGIAAFIYPPTFLILTLPLRWVSAPAGLIV